MFILYMNSILQPDYYRDAPHFRLIGAGPQYRLEIPYAKLDFTGTYSVIARNCHGEAKAVISLQIYAKGKLQRYGRNLLYNCCTNLIQQFFQDKAKKNKRRNLLTGELLRKLSDEHIHFYLAHSINKTLNSIERY